MSIAKAFIYWEMNNCTNIKVSISMIAVQENRKIKNAKDPYCITAGLIRAPNQGKVIYQSCQS